MAAPADEWRIAVSGSWATGWMGFLGRHGLPREQLLTTQLTDPNVLRRYRLVIVAAPVGPWHQALPVLEQYVRDGGAAILEYTAFPTEGMLPGERIDGQAGPNLVIEPGHPAVAGIPAGRTYARMQEPAAAIVPAAGANVAVLARYTEVGAVDKVRGRFLRNGQSVPAILYAAVGKGRLIYSGPYLADSLAFGADYNDLCLAMLRFLSDGRLVPRMALAGPQDLLTMRPWTPATSPPAGTGAPAALPQGFALVENLGGAFGEYDVSAALKQDGELFLDYAGPTKHYAVHLGKDGVRIGVANGGPEVELAAAARAAAPSGAEVLVARRRGAIRVLVNHQFAVEAADRGQWGGLVAAKGLGDPAVQPIASVRFTDDFMREQGDAGNWHAVTGNWQIVSSEGTPAQGANPFSYGAETSETALATVGEWFWDDYRAEVSARWTQNAAGLVFHYHDPGNYDLLQADLATQTLRLCRVRGGQPQVVKEAPAALRPWRWYRLGVAASRGMTVATLDGAPVLGVFDPEAGGGPIGLYIRNAKAAFDDVAVSDWRMFAGPSTAREASWRPLTGKWLWTEDGRIVARGTSDRLQAPEVWGDARVAVDLRLNRAERAGVRLRAADGKAGEVVIQRVNGATQLRLELPGAQGRSVSREAPLKGFQADAWHTLSVTALRESIACRVDGALVASAASIGLPPEGAVSLLSDGSPGADFRSVDLRPLEDGFKRVDPATPAYAGVVDVTTWATPAEDWVPDPSDLSFFRHDGKLAGDLRLRIGVHPAASGKAAAMLILTPEGGQAGGGYVARFERQPGTGAIAVSLTRAGQDAAYATGPGATPAGGFLAELERLDDVLILRVNGKAALAYNDPTPLDCPRVGVRLDGATLCYDDMLLESPNVRTDTFAEAPSNWLAQLGTWEVTSRWTCSPGWTWLSGVAPDFAVTQSKWETQGDVFLDAYLAPKMMNTPAGRKEVLQEIRLGICGQPGFLNSGYFFLIGAKSGTWTALQRNGVVVAETSDLRIGQGALHNNWFRFGVLKQGAKVTLLYEGQPVLSYTDPDPLPGGRISLGAYDNGIMIPRVTVYADQIRG
jgi:hypothetical protein